MKRNNRSRGRNRTEKKKKEALQYLPHELVIQILLRLPVKSLIRFKCVCKSWFSLISDPHFANSHFQFSAATPTPTILLISDSSLRESLFIDFEASPLNDDSVSASLNLNNFMPFKSYRSIEIRGSCRGFLLLHCYNNNNINLSWIYDIYIWNPSTGFHKQLPLSLFVSQSDDCFHFYGFGYDQSTDDYLLVTMSSKFFLYPPPPHLEFFSLRANTRTEIEGTQFSYRTIMNYEEPGAGFLFNGAIHWVAHCVELREHVIVAFDLTEKKLFNIHLPDDFDREFGELCNFGLWVFGEFLSLWAVYDLGGDVHDNSTLEIWVMKEYKVDSLWTKTLVLSFYGDFPKYYSPICSTKSGDIIVKKNHDSVLAKYNDQRQLLEYHSYFNDRHRFQEALYIESLLSLPDNEQA